MQSYFLMEGKKFLMLNVFESEIFLIRKQGKGLQVF